MRSLLSLQPKCASTNCDISAPQKAMGSGFEAVCIRVSGMPYFNKSSKSEARREDPESSFFFDELFAVRGLVRCDYFFGEFVGHVVVV